MNQTAVHIEAQGLEKSYGVLKAVDNVSFQVKRGQCFGLLGPNGAGKTTTIEMMEGITEPSAGRVLLNGQPFSKAARHKIGIQFQSTSLPDFLTVKECLHLFASLYKHSRPIDELIRMCALEEFLERDNRKLSGGQRQRLFLALALVNDPEIVFLDEPTTGLDPQARRNLWALVEKIKTDGKSVVLTTHYMEEAYVLCDEIAIMDKGKIIARGAPKELLQTYFEGHFLEIPEADLQGKPPSLFSEKYHRRGDVIEFLVPDVKTALRELISQNINLNQMSVRSASLEDLFLQLTGKELRE
jgi:ABC-2 type transport system ATP-binding protein